MESSRPRDELVAPEIPKRILRVPKNWGKQRAIVPQEFQQFLPNDGSKKTDFERAVTNIFEGAGFTVVRGGQFNPNNLSEIGIHARETEFKRQYDRNRRIAEEAGVDMPQAYLSPEEILDSEGPIIAKFDAAQRGAYKYYLDTPDKKVRYLTAVLLGRELLEMLADGTLNTEMGEYTAMVRNRDFSGILDPNKEGGLFSQYVCEKFIETPSQYNTSFRIVADASGQVHFGILLRSPFETRSPQYFSLRSSNSFIEDLIIRDLIDEQLIKKDGPLHKPKGYCLKSLCRGESDSVKWSTNYS